MAITDVGPKGEPQAVASGSAPTFAADITDLIAHFYAGRTFRKLANWAALIAATGMEDNDLAIVDTIDGATFKYDAAAATWRMHGVARFADAAARGTALPSPVAGMLALAVDTGVTSRYSGSAWVAQQGSDDTGWTAATLAGAWVVFGGAHAAPGYRRVGTRVELRGTAKSGATGTLFTLPAGYRPPFDFYFNAMANGGTAQLSVSASTGVVAVLGYISPATNAILSIQGISFYTD